MNGSGGESKHDGGGLAAAHAREPQSIPLNAIPHDLDLTTRVLRFLSTASPETIGGIAVGLSACTYFLLGRVGLVLIGAVGGIVLHAAWERHASGLGIRGELQRREASLDIARRLLDLRENLAAETEGCDIVHSGPGFAGFRPDTAAALNDLVDAVIRDYVKWWYHPILPQENDFPAASRQTLTNLILAVSNHLSRKRPADTFLNFLTNSSSILIVFLNELSAALTASQGTNLSPAEAVYTYLAENPESNLASVLNQKHQAEKFGVIAEDILLNFLEKSAYNCGPARIFLREILAGVALEMTLKTCSRPEWINGWIVYLLEEGEPDISQAIDAGMATTNGKRDSSMDILEGNIGSMGVAKVPKVANQEQKKHRKRLSKAEEAMEEAMEEAKRLSQLIAEEEAEKEGDVLVKEIPVSGITASVPSTTPSAAPSKTDMKERPESRVASDEQLNLDPNPLDLTNNSRTKSATVSSLTHPTSQSHSPTSVTTSSASPSPTVLTAPFTNFDQIVPQSTPAALTSPPRRQTVSLTLHNANILIYDDSTPLDKGKMRSKPNADYLVQIEPKSSDHPGWMIVRKYTDFETLHEVLRRIAQISGVTAFAEQHNSLPSWKEHTKSSLRGELERYLRDACWYQQLAESEGMKRFLEKEHQGQQSNSQKASFGWPTPSAFESMGKGMLDALVSAPKGVAEGGKAIGEGISGVFTNIGSLGQKKPPPPPINSIIPIAGSQAAGRSSVSNLPRLNSTTSLSGSRKGRASEDSLRVTTPIIQNSTVHGDANGATAKLQSRMKASERSDLLPRDHQ